MCAISGTKLGPGIGPRGSPEFRFRLLDPLQLQRRLDFPDHRIECRGIGNRDFRQALAVELDLRGFEAGDELAVAQVPLAASSAEPRDPEPPEVALAGATVAKGKCAGAFERLFNRPE